MRPGIGLLCQIPQWPLLLLPTSPHPPPPFFPQSSSTPLLCLPLLLKTSPSRRACWQGFFTPVQPEGSWCVPGHAEASRHVMAPQPLLLAESTGVPEVEGKQRRARRLLKEFLNNYCRSADESWCVCATALGRGRRSLVCRRPRSWLPLSVLIATDQHRSDTRGMRQSPSPKHAMHLNLCSQGQFKGSPPAAWMIHPLWKMRDCQRKTGNCVCEVYQRAANGRIWLLNDCIIHFWTYNVKQGDTERGEGRRRSRTGEMWQNQGMCEKGGKTRLRRRYLGHTEFFFFFLNSSHNMQRVCYLGCPAAAVLQGNATTVKLCFDSLCRTCYYSPKATIWSFSLPNEWASQIPQPL